MFDTGKLFKGAVNLWLFPDLCFLQFSVAQMLVGLRKQFINKFIFPTWACAAGFNSNNNKKKKHLCSVSRPTSQRLGILRKPWQEFHDRLLLGKRFWIFVLPFLEYCSAVWCSATDTHLKLLDRVVSGASFLTVGACA